MKPYDFTGTCRTPGCRLVVGIVTGGGPRIQRTEIPERSPRQIEELLTTLLTAINMVREVVDEALASRHRGYVSHCLIG